MVRRPELVIVNGDKSGKRFSVTTGVMRLGRSSSNDIHIPDERLSRNHCMFTPFGEDGIRLTDLASANGTFVNGREIGSDYVDLKIGDSVEVGSTILKVVGEDVVDLGLGSVKPADDGKNPVDAPEKKRSPFSLLLWALALLLAGLALYFLFFAPPMTQEAPAVEVQEVKQTVSEVYYEKVEANNEGIFRYEMTLSPQGVLKVAIDDVPKENRHLTKAERLNEESLRELNEILAFENLRDIDREYVGVEPDPPALESWRLKVVYSTRARTIRIVNTREPEAFRQIREKLETFSKNQLGIWAIQYSREKLIELAEEAVNLGRTKWEDRDVQYGNLFDSVAAFKEAIFYLETVNPKPPCANAAHKGLEQSEAELVRRYRDQRFLADRAINLQRWEDARKEL
jgi:pSer/pThr/pTyr-binding forkhead associated (FHA) protein